MNDCVISPCEVQALSSPVGSPLRRYAWFRRFHAWALHKGNPRYERAVAESKRALIGQLRGTVLEIGPGSGSSLAHFRRDVRWIGVEPNAWAHRYLREKALALGLVAEIHEAAAETLPLADASVDAVVTSLVLCSVTDVDRSLAEIRRVLGPGGRFVFFEHVAAPAGSLSRRVQRLLRLPQAVLGDGCRPDQDTWAAIERTGFSTAIHCPERFRVPLPVPHITGVAIR